MTLRLAVVTSALALTACSGGGGSAPAPPMPAHAASSLREATATAAPATVQVTAAKPGATISRLIIGANMAAWVDITEGNLEPALAKLGYTATRWPGGSESDVYHWQTNTSCDGGYTDSNSTFDNFENDIAKPAKLDVAITLNYGSNAACNGPGDASEAAAWVAHAKAENDNIKYWTVGNEQYGSWEYDLHSDQHDPTTYANAVATQYYPAIKNADPNAQVGVTVEGDGSWDSTVLADAKYDFVELHFYDQAPGQENDDTLLTKGAPALTSLIDTVKSELSAAGHPNTPIYLGELGSVYGNPGKQSTSITQALFAGMALGEMMNDGVFRATWWLAYGGCDDSSSGANFSSSLYGWQNFGGYMTISDGTPEYGCSNATTVPRGVALPTARAYQLMAPVAQDGEHALPVSVNSSLSTVRAYAASHGTGYAVVLFNLDENAAHTVTIGVDKLTSGSAYSVSTYGKAQYDESKTNDWVGPVASTKSAWSGPVSVSLPAWSMTVVHLAK